MEIISVQVPVTYHVSSVRLRFQMKCFNCIYTSSGAACDLAAGGGVAPLEAGNLLACCDREMGVGLGGMRHMVSFSPEHRPRFRIAPPQHKPMQFWPVHTGHCAEQQTRPLRLPLLHHWSSHMAGSSAGFCLVASLDVSSSSEGFLLVPSLRASGLLVGISHVVSSKPLHMPCLFIWPPQH